MCAEKKKKIAKKKIQITSIDDLKPAEYNPRTITEEAIDGLKNSIKEFGDISGIVWNKRTGNLVSGHQRIKAIKDKFGNNVKIKNNIIICDKNISFPIRVVDWDEITEKAANLTANNTLIQGEFDSDLLKSLVDEIETFDMYNIDNNISIDSMMEDLRIDELINDFSSTDEMQNDLAGKANKKNDEVEFIKKNGEENKIIKLAFEHYSQEKNFPFPPYKTIPDYELWQKFISLCLIGIDSDLDIVPNGSHGVSIANQFNPEIYQRDSKQKKRVEDYFRNKDDLLSILNKTLVTFNSKLSDATIFGISRMFKGMQLCSNFRPIAAKYLYQRYFNTDIGCEYVLDPCIGYGGRLLGFLSWIAYKKNNIKYVGFDPGAEQYNGNTNMAKFFGYDKKAILTQSPFEDITVKKHMKITKGKGYNMIMTSPPYFDREFYGEEEGQARNRYKNPEDFNTLFLDKMFSVCSETLAKPGCFFILNIANLKNAKTKKVNLEKQSLILAKKYGFKHIETLEYRLAKLPGKNLSSKTAVTHDDEIVESKNEKYEPVYVFAKC